MRIAKHARIRERIAVEQAENAFREIVPPPGPNQLRKRREAEKVLQLLDDIAVEKLRSEAFEKTASREDRNT